MAGSYTGTQQDSAFDLDLKTEELISLLESLESMDGEDTPDISLGITAGGSGVSVFDAQTNEIHLQQPAHERIDYDWIPPTDCEIELISGNACVVIDNRDVYTKLGIAGLSVPLRAGTPTKFSAISSSGQLSLKIHERLI